MAENRAPVGLQLEFCGEIIEIDRSVPFSIGRDADFIVDENPYLHRRFLDVRWKEGVWWLSNVGSQLAATLSDRASRMQAWLAPGAHLPIVFEESVVRFAAGPTSYELILRLESPVFSSALPEGPVQGSTTTLGRVTFTLEQRLLLVALAEPVLRHGSGRSAELPSSAVAATRLGWSLTKFNRKLDYVCQKLTRAGVQGLHGSSDRLASMRRSRLVEYALAVQIVSVGDLPLLDDSGLSTPSNGSIEL